MAWQPQFTMTRDEQVTYDQALALDLEMTQNNPDLKADVDIINIPLMQTRLRMLGDYNRLNAEDQELYRNLMSRITLAEEEQKNQDLAKRMEGRSNQSSGANRFRPLQGTSNMPQRRTVEQDRALVLANLQSRKHQLQPEPSNRESKIPRVEENDEAVLALTSQVEDKMELDKKKIPPPPIGFRNIEDFRFRQCAVSLNPGHWVGSFFGKSIDYTVSVGVDGGRFGQPKLSLRFCVNKVLGKEVETSKKDSNAYHKCQFAWTPGPGDFELFRGFAWQDRHRNTEFQEPSKALLNAFAEENQKDKLFCIQFRRRYTEKSIVDGVETSSRLWEILKPKYPDVAGLLDEIATGSTMITIWFLATPSLEDFCQRCFAPFEHAVRHQLPTLYQYLNQKGESVVDFKETEKIDKFQGGMYARYPMKKVNNKMIPDVTAEPTGFYTLPEKHYLREETEARLLTEVGAVREAQYQEGQIMHLGIRPHRVQLVRICKLKPVRLHQGVMVKDIIPKLLSAKDKNEINKTFKAYVYLTPDAKGFKETVPSEGEFMSLDFGETVYRKGGKGLFIRDQKAKQWSGRVITPDVGALETTGADFCLRVTRPSGGNSQPINEAIDRLEAKNLLNVWLQPEFNETSVTREIQAIRKLFEERDDLEIVRETIMGKPDVVQTTVLTDLTKGPSAAKLSPDQERENQKIYQERMRSFKQELNAGQYSVLESASKISNRIQLARGPPGSGKSKTIAALVFCLVAIGHKVLLVGPSNGTVDENVHKIHTLKPKWLPNLRYLRLETIGQIKATANILGDVQGRDADKPTLSKEAREKAAEKELEVFIGHLFDKAVELDVNRDDAFIANVEDVGEEYRQLKEKKQSVKTFPIAASMPWRVEEEIADICRPFQNESAADMATRKREGRLPDAYKAVSYYQQLVQQLKNGGEPLNRNDKEYLWGTQKRLENMAIRASHVLITTCTISGWDKAVDEFGATAVIIDEGAQATLATTLIPLTFYPGWDGAYIVGDEMQLEPTHLSVGNNEAGANYGVSLFVLMVAKGIQPITLTEQFRMCPAISKWPAKWFYGEDLVDSKLVKVDNPTRMAMREVSKVYGVKNTGSEYFVVDVIHGRSRVESQGTSLQNYAHADAIHKLIRCMLDHGIKLHQISVLTYYRGQIKTITLRAGPDGFVVDTVATVDSYQGQEAEVTIVDFVAAGSLEQNESSYAGVTAHLRKKNRLCVAVTRGKYGEVIICNGRTMAAGAKDKANAAMTSLMWDAHQRGVITYDETTRDEHPESLAEDARRSDAEQKHHLEQIRMESHGWVDRLNQVAHQQPQQNRQRGPKVIAKTDRGRSNQNVATGRIVQNRAQPGLAGNDPRPGEAAPRGSSRPRGGGVTIPDARLSWAARVTSRDTEKEIEAQKERKQRDMDRQAGLRALETHTRKKPDDKSKDKGKSKDEDLDMDDGEVQEMDEAIGLAGMKVVD